MPNGDSPALQRDLQGLRDYTDTRFSDFRQNYESRHRDLQDAMSAITLRQGHLEGKLTSAENKNAGISGALRTFYVVAAIIAAALFGVIGAIWNSLEQHINATVH